MKTDGDILMQKRKDAKKEPPRFLGFFIRRGNIWLALVLLVANLAAWVSVASRVNLRKQRPFCTRKLPRFGRIGRRGMR